MIAGALLFYQFNSWKNRLLTRVRRLRQPKYLLGALAGGAYFYFFFIRPNLTGRRAGMMFPAMSPQYHDLAQSIAAGLLFVAFLLAWIIPHSRAGLAFTEAEVAFLFPAPISRRTLIHFKLLKSQTSILLGALVFALIGRSWGGGSFLIRAFGWWLVLSTMNLHALGSSFTLTMLMDRGISNWKRRLGVLGMAVVVVGGSILWTCRAVPAPTGLVGSGGLADYIEQVMGSGALPYLLLPFRIVVGPFLANTAHQWLLAVPSALAVMALHYLWVIRSNVAFEEASLESSRKLAERLAAMQSGNWQATSQSRTAKHPPFKLAPTGQPAIALLWKNLISAGSLFTTRLWLFLVWTVVFGGFLGTTISHSQGVFAAVATVALFLLGLSLFVGPQVLRQDFRQDLLTVDLLKLYPMRGWQVALGEVLAPVAILTAVQWLLILVAALFCPATMGHFEVSLQVRWGIGLAAALVLPFLNMLCLLIPNSAVLILPAWFQLGKVLTPGIETMGQRLILMVGQMLILAVSLLVPAGLFALTFWASHRFVGNGAGIFLGALPAALIMGAEGFFGVRFLGDRFEKFDLSAELSE